MSERRPLPMFATSVLTLTLLGSISFSGCATSGVMGKVLIRTPCPAPRAAQTCLRPYEVTLQIRKGAQGPVVTRVHAGPDGQFRARLSPGGYVIETLPGSTSSYASPHAVTITRHKYAKVTIEFDRLR